MNVRRRVFALTIGLAAFALPAAAQWERVVEVPASNVFSLFAKGDTLAAGTRDRVYVSTDAGASWLPPTQQFPPQTVVGAVCVEDRRLFAGTAGQGVFVSDDLGVSWQGFNQGLVGGILNTQLDISDFQVRGDSIYVGTFGAGVYVRNLAGAGGWSHFGEEFEPNQASNVNALAVGGTRLLAAAGGNGSVFFRDPGDADWTISWLDNVGLHPPLQASSATWTGTGWVAGVRGARGVFRSVLGQEPWTFVGLGLGVLDHATFATRGPVLFGAFDVLGGVVIQQSDDDGASWELLDALPGKLIVKLVVSGDRLFAAQTDGLWVRSSNTVSVPPADGTVSRLQFSLAGQQPIHGMAQFHFDLPAAGPVTIDVFDVSGRRVDRIARSFGAGPHELSWNAQNLSAGVYLARMSAAGMAAVVRIVHIR